jgi:hypothetical protein
MRSNQEKELAWFGPGASLPVVSMDAERAARQILRAMLRRRPEVILSWPAKLIALLHGVFPGTTAVALGWVNRLVLPRPAGAGRERARGGQVQERMRSPLLNWATSWGLAAAGRFQPPRSAPP